MACTGGKVERAVWAAGLRQHRVYAELASSQRHVGAGPVKPIDRSAIERRHRRVCLIDERRVCFGGTGDSNRCASDTTIAAVLP